MHHLTKKIQIEITCLLQTMKLYLFTIKISKNLRFQLVVSFRQCNKTVAYRNHNGFYEWRRASFVKSRPIIIIMMATSGQDLLRAIKPMLNYRKPNSQIVYRQYVTILLACVGF